MYQHYCKMDRFELLYSGEVNNLIPVYKYKSKNSGLRVAVAQVEGPLVNGFFCLGKHFFSPFDFRLTQVRLLLCNCYKTQKGHFPFCCNFIIYLNMSICICKSLAYFRLGKIVVNAAQTSTLFYFYLYAHK